MNNSVNRSEIDFSKPVDNTFFMSKPDYTGIGVISYMVKLGEDDTTNLKMSARDVVESEKDYEFNTIYVRCEVTQKSENIDVRIEDSGLAFCSTPLSDIEKSIIKATFDILCLKKTGKNLEENILDLRREIK